jgi:hypothetical protein
MIICDKCKSAEGNVCHRRFLVVSDRLHVEMSKIDSRDTSLFDCDLCDRCFISVETDAAGIIKNLASTKPRLP